MRNCEVKRKSKTSQMVSAFGYDFDCAISVRKMRNKRKVQGKSRPKAKHPAKVQGVK